MIETKLLVVDDEPDLCNILKFNLESNGYMVDLANSAEEALKLDLKSYHLLLLDVMMPGISGFELLEIIRTKNSIDVPAIFITAMGSENNLLKGFNLGADDYIKKPFSIVEVLARVKAVLERYKYPEDSISKNIGIKLDTLHKQIHLDKESINLTPTEFDILSLLINQPGKVYSRDVLLKHIWSYHQDIKGRAVDVNITRIRKKMGNWGKCIVTRSGYGYYYDVRKIDSLCNT